jgi:hypothetical protein
MKLCVLSSFSSKRKILVNREANSQNSNGEYQRSIENKRYSSDGQPQLITVSILVSLEPVRLFQCNVLMNYMIRCIANTQKCDDVRDSLSSCAHGRSSLNIFHEFVGSFCAVCFQR